MKLLFLLSLIFITGCVNTAPKEKTWYQKKLEREAEVTRIYKEKKRIKNECKEKFESMQSPEFEVRRRFYYNGEYYKGEYEIFSKKINQNNNIKSKYLKLDYKKFKFKKEIEKNILKFKPNLKNNNNIIYYERKNYPALKTTQPETTPSQQNSQMKNF